MGGAVLRRQWRHGAGIAKRSIHGAVSRQCRFTAQQVGRAGLADSDGGLTCVACLMGTLQGYLAHKNQPPRPQGFHSAPGIVLLKC